MTYQIGKSAIPIRKELQQGTRILIFLLTVLFFASFISPQVVFLGRGARLTLPVFTLLIFLILIDYPPQSVIRSIFENEHNARLKYALIFVGFGLLRQQITPNSILLHTFVINPTFCIMAYIVIALICDLHPSLVHPIRWLILITLGVSLGLSIPTLYDNQGIARLTMGRNADANTWRLSSGVTSYTMYTAVAIAWPSIAQWLYNFPRQTIVQVMGWGALLAASVAVIFSTFSMASMLLVLGIFMWVSLNAFSGKNNWLRAVTVIAIAIFVFQIPNLYNQALETAPTEYSVNKITTFYEDSRALGLQSGDHTGRVTMFIETMETFSANFLFGIWGLKESARVGGHSSWADTLAVFGILGLFLWLRFLWPSLKRKEPFSVAGGVAGGTVSWMLFMFGGILNPTFYFPQILALLWLYDIAAMSKPVAVSKPRETQPKVNRYPQIGPWR